MYKLMIVDDEPFIADGLAELFEQLSEISFEVFTAYSAPDALARLDQIRMDIVISDIKMPKMSGIEMLEQIKKRWSRCHVIFLTGYSDFSYVQSALSCGADAYLLKGQSDEEIIAAVMQSIRAIEKEYSSDCLQVRIREEYERALPILQKDFISRVLREPYTESCANLQNMLEHLRLPMLAVEPMMLVGARMDAGTEPSASTAELCIKMDAIFCEYMHSKANTFSYFDEHGHLFWFLQRKANLPDYDFFLSGIVGTLENVQSACQKTGLPVSFVWDSALYDWQQLSVAYERLRSALIFLLDAKSELVLCDIHSFSKLSEDANKIPAHLQSKRIQDLHASLECGQREDYIVGVDHFITQIQDSADPLRQFSAYHGLCTFLLELIEQSGQKNQYLQYFGSFTVFSTPYSQWTPRIAEEFRKIAIFLFDNCNNKQEQHTHHVIHMLHQYIAEHLSEDLTLSTLAAQVYLNPVYLSRVYRQSTGQKLSEYVLTCRIAEAQKLLRNQNTKINEIALQVGFDSAAHFSRVFKKRTSFTPAEYREK